MPHGNTEITPTSKQQPSGQRSFLKDARESMKTAGFHHLTKTDRETLDSELCLKQGNQKRIPLAIFAGYGLI
jgi:hypothetical protein